MNPVNNKEDEFLKAENEGRRKAAKLFGNKYTYTFSEDKYSSYDVVVNGIDSNSYVEIKNRNNASTTYDSDFLEYAKLRNLKNEANDDKMYYLCFYNDGVARLYDLKNIDITQVEIKELPIQKHTAQDSYLVNKLMIELPIKLATKTYKNIY